MDKIFSNSDILVKLRMIKEYIDTIKTGSRSDSQILRGSDDLADLLRSLYGFESIEKIDIPENEQNRAEFIRKRLDFIINQLKKKIELDEDKNKLYPYDPKIVTVSDNVDIDDIKSVLQRSASNISATQNNIKELSNNNIKLSLKTVKNMSKNLEEQLVKIKAKYDRVSGTTQEDYYVFNPQDVFYNVCPNTNEEIELRNINIDDLKQQIESFRTRLIELKEESRKCHEKYGDLQAKYDEVDNNDNVKRFLALNLSDYSKIKSSRDVYIAILERILDIYFLRRNFYEEFKEDYKKICGKDLPDTFKNSLKKENINNIFYINAIKKVKKYSVTEKVVFLKDNTITIGDNVDQEEIKKTIDRILQNIHKRGMFTNLPVIPNDTQNTTYCSSDNGLVRFAMFLTKEKEKLRKLYSTVEKIDINEAVNKISEMQDIERCINIDREIASIPKVSEGIEMLDMSDDTIKKNSQELKKIIEKSIKEYNTVFGVINKDIKSINNLFEGDQLNLSLMSGGNINGYIESFDIYNTDLVEYNNTLKHLIDLTERYKNLLYTIYSVGNRRLKDTIQISVFYLFKYTVINKTQRVERYIDASRIDRAIQKLEQKKDKINTFFYDKCIAQYLKILTLVKRDINGRCVDLLFSKNSYDLVSALKFSEL